MERNPVGKEVIHFSYGRGIIKKLEHEKISVLFYEKDAIIKFHYPLCMGGVLNFCEERIQDIEYPTEVEIVEEHKDIDNTKFDILILESHWKNDGSLYLPYIKLEIKNKTSIDVKKIYVEIVFINKDNRELWSETDRMIIDRNDYPIKPKESTIAEFYGGIGYSEALSTERLPIISSEIYLNNHYCGEVKIRQAYSSPTIMRIYKDYVKYERYSFTRLDDRKLQLVVTANHWRKNYDIYAPFLRIEVFNQTEYDLNDLSLKTVFINQYNNESWGETIEGIINPNQKPLKPGYKKPVFIRCNLGYKSMFSVEHLPLIIAKLYINDVFYGEINIEKTYTYIELRQELMTYDDELLFPEETDDEQSVITVEDVVVKSLFNKCIYKNHILKDVNALVCVYVWEDGEIVIREVSAEARYCEECKVYYIYESEFQKLKRIGRICCNVYDEEEYIRLKQESNPWNLKPESVLRQYGYTVNASDNYSTFHRQQILRFLCDNDILSKDRIISHISWLIDKNSHRDRYSNAVRKWREDLLFIKNYNNRNADKTIKVRSIYRKKRHYMY